MLTRLAGPKLARGHLAGSRSYVFPHTAMLDGSPPPPSKGKHVAYIFSGPYKRPDGLSAHLKLFGVDCSDYDNGQHCYRLAGGWSHDFMNDKFYAQLVHDIEAGLIYAIVASPPCGTYSAARFLAMNSSDPGPIPLRDIDNPDGFPLSTLPVEYHRELLAAQLLVRRLADLLLLADSHGVHWVIENPAPRHDRDYLDGRLFYEPTAKHGSLWTTTPIDELARTTSARLVTFAYCAMGHTTQKYTSLLYSKGLHPTLSLLATLLCDHPLEMHTKAIGKPDGVAYATAKLAPWPTRLCATIAYAIAYISSPPPSIDAIPIIPAADAPPLPSAPLPAAPAMDDAPSQIPQPSPPVQQPPGPRPDGGHFTFRQRNAKTVALASLLLPTLTQAQSSPTVLFTRPVHHASADAAAAYTTDHRLHSALYSVDTHTCLLATTDNRTPSGHSQAMKFDEVKWTASELKELDAHKRNGSWVLIDRSRVPRDANIVNALWIYKLKRDGTAKSRLCVDGSNQQYGIDYDQTHASTLRTSTLRVLGSIMAHLGLSSRRYDLVAAYLQGDLEPGELIYLRQPPGHVVKGSDGLERVAVVQKPIYGMKQAGRRLQRKLFPWFRQWEDGKLTQLYADSCVFIAREGDDILIIGIFVDDCCVLYKHGTPGSLFDRFSKAFFEAWEAEDEGELSDLLNIHYKVSEDSVTLHQAPYIAELATRFFPDGIPSKLRSNQCPYVKELPAHVLEAVTDGTSKVSAEDHKRYRSMTGALIYLAVCTRPDIAYAVGMLSRAMHCPTSDLMADAERVLCYLLHHSEIGLTYNAGMKDPLAMADSDWATRRSTSGWLVMWHNAAITWGSKQQATIALSSCEAEIMAASKSAQEVIYVRQLLTELGFPPSGPTPQGCDNKAARDTAYNPENHERMKHVERRHLYIRECIERGEIVVPYVRTCDNLADFFTKCLAPAEFFPMRDKIMNVTL